MINTENAAAATSQCVLQKLYLKDLSFESPRPAESFSVPELRPAVEIDANAQVRKIDDEHYEVTLRVTVTASRRETGETLYLIEVSQAGLFALTGFNEAELLMALNGYCPNVLLTYAREVVSTTVVRGGFPSLLLKPIQFEHLYQQYIKEYTERKEQPEKADHTE